MAQMDLSSFFSFAEYYTKRDNAKRYNFSRNYPITSKGAETLEGEWKPVKGATAAKRAAMRFFKVVVELP